MIDQPATSESTNTSTSTSTSTSASDSAAPSAPVADAAAVPIAPVATIHEGTDGNWIVRLVHRSGAVTDAVVADLREAVAHLRTWIEAHV